MSRACRRSCRHCACRSAARGRRPLYSGWMPPHVTRTGAELLAELPAPLRELAAQGVQRRYRTHTVLIEEGVGPSNVYVVHETGRDIIVAANREKAEAALYFVS